MFVENQHYREYEWQLVRLHQLIERGAGGSHEAIELREEMEQPEAQLAPIELARLNELSGDLSMLHDREIPDPAVVKNVPAAQIPQRLRAAYEQKDWNELLRLLRA